jgi:hypothetical protein
MKKIRIPSRVRSQLENHTKEQMRYLIDHLKGEKIRKVLVPETGVANFRQGL